MKFSYRFSNLLGSVYRKGNVTFTPDGSSVLSPVGNRVTVFDLKNNKSETLPLENSRDITCVALSPDGYTLILVNEEGEAQLISLISKSVLHTYHFHQPVHDVKFSPDGKKFAVTRDSVVLLFYAPGNKREFNPFVLQRTFFGAYDDNMCIDWTTDSKALCVGSKDMSTRVYGAERFTNLIAYALGGHGDSIVGAFFELASLNVYTISRNGRVCVWQCDTKLSGLKPYVPPPDQQNEEFVDIHDEKALKKKSEEEAKAMETEEKVLYKKIGKHSFRGYRGSKRDKEGNFNYITCVAYHKMSHTLVTGFQDGSFHMHEMPDFNIIQTLSISDQIVASATFNSTGDWIALGCAGLGQLLVWEWQSQTYVLKQQGHFNNMTCLAYSPDGQNIATGGDDGKVKVWNTSSGFCFVTFKDHLGGITDVAFNQNGQVVLSSSLDGTVRAFDLNRYRNFRTFTSPRPAQFSCLSVDHSGELVSAGGLDTFEVFVWSMQTGKLLEVLAGHEGPISCLSFSSTQSLLASASWDKTVKLWDIFESKGAKETLTFVTDVLAVTFRPDGKEIAIATLDAQISFWDPATAIQKGSIEGRRDLGYSRKEQDKITAKKASFGKAFTTVCYSADGYCVLAAGKSKNVCIYSVPDQLLMKKFEITCNMSFDGMEEYLDKKKMTEWGSLSLVDQGEGDSKSISLPGVRKGDMSARNWKPEVRVTSVRFSPTGRAWAAASTEGLLIYSLDHNLVFDPFDLEIDITPKSVRATLARGDHSVALMLSFRLNEINIIQEVIESIPASDVAVICENLADVYVDKLLRFVANQLESTAHLEFYTLWINKLLMFHGPKLKKRSQKVMATLRTLQKNITRKNEELGTICDHNKYSMDFIIAMSKAKRKRDDSVTQTEAVEEREEATDEIMDVIEPVHSDDEHSLNSEDENFMSNFLDT